MMFSISTVRLCFILPFVSPFAMDVASKSDFPSGFSTATLAATSMTRSDAIADSLVSPGCTVGRSASWRCPRGERSNHPFPEGGCVMQLYNDEMGAMLHKACNFCETPDDWRCYSNISILFQETILNQILKFRKLSLAFAGVTHQDGALPRGRGGRGGRGRGLVLNHGRLRLKLQLLVEIYICPKTSGWLFIQKYKAETYDSWGKFQLSWDVLLYVFKPWRGEVTEILPAFKSQES